MQKLSLIFILCVSILNAVVTSDRQVKRAFDECVKAYINGNIQICQKIITRGLPSLQTCTKDSCEAVGVIYEYAMYFDQAEQYFSRAIMLGDNSAYFSLGDLYEQKNSIPLARRYYKNGCDRADNESCDGLGSLYMKSKDYPIARKYWGIACNRGFKASCNKLFMAYFRGDGIRQNLSLAKQYCAKAYSNKSCESLKDLNATVAENAQLSAQSPLNIFVYKIRTNKNDEFGRLLNNANNGDSALREFNISLVDYALKSNNVPSVNECDKNTCYVLGRFYAFEVQGENPAKIADINKGVAYLKRAGDLGNALGYETLAMIYQNNGNLQMANQYYNLSCQMGNATSCQNVR